MDIHMAIEENLTNIPPRELLWIKGHQDNTTDVADLSGDALLNVEVDALANAFYYDSPTFLPLHPSQCCTTTAFPSLGMPDAFYNDIMERQTSAISSWKSILTGHLKHLTPSLGLLFFPHSRNAWTLNARKS